MSNFGGKVQEYKQGARPRPSSDYLRLTPDHSAVIRVLDEEPEVSFQHFVRKGHPAFPNVNAGKGMSFMCPGQQTCPVCAWNQEAKAKDPNDKNLMKLRKVFTFNVLDRTPIVTCPKCNAEIYENGRVFPEKCSCGADLVDVEAQPRNKIMLLQKGTRLIESLEGFEADPDLGDLRGYDIKIDTRGTGTETVNLCVPKQKAKLDLAKILGADYVLHDVKAIVTPFEIEQITRILNGEDWASVFANKADEEE